MTTELSRQKIEELAAQYRRDGFEVLIEPDAGAVPFDLGGYRPDILATKGDRHDIVEVRDFGVRLSVDRFQTLAREISRHAGWRFILATTDEQQGAHGSTSDILPTWEGLRDQLARASRLREVGGPDAVLLSTWAVFEGILRRRATEVTLPVERFPTVGLIKHLYSHGELSMAEYDCAMRLLETRNGVAHGFARADVDVASAKLLTMTQRLFEEWRPQSAAA